MEKHHCYGNQQIFNKVTCKDDNCNWYLACSIKCGNKVDMFEYKLVELLIGTVTKTELLELLGINYGISYNASKQAIKRWKRNRIRNENNNTRK